MIIDKPNQRIFDPQIYFQRISREQILVSCSLTGQLEPMDLRMLAEVPTSNAARSVDCT